MQIGKIQTRFPVTYDISEGQLYVVNNGVQPINIEGGSSYLVKAEVTLTDAQIKALPTTPIQVADAPGADKFISLIHAVIILDNVNGGYGNIAGGTSTLVSFGVGELVALQTASSLYVESDMGDFEFPSSSPFPIMFSAPANIGTGLFAAAGPADSNSVNNKPLYILGANGVNGNFTGGNAANTLKVTVYYVIVDL